LYSVARSLRLPVVLPPIDCALAMARLALSLPRYRLRDVCFHLGVHHVPHDPLSDAVAAAQVVLAIARMSSEELDAG
jgi:DNA polymerase III epsilon subunit-like protein